MTGELLDKLEEETLRELEYAQNMKTMESDAYEQVMTQVRDNCKVIYDGVKANNDEYKTLEEVEREKEESDFRKQTKALDVSEHRKDRWVNVAVTTAGVVIPLIAYGFMYKLGLTFEENGTITSQFFKNLLNKIKPT